MTLFHGAIIASAFLAALPIALALLRAAALWALDDSGARYETAVVLASRLASGGVAIASFAFAAGIVAGLWGAP